MEVERQIKLFLKNYLKSKPKKKLFISLNFQNTKSSFYVYKYLSLLECIIAI